MANLSIPVFGLIAYTALLCSSCTTTKPTHEGADNINSAIIVIPGFKGSRLVERDSGRCAWLCVREVLLGRKTLTLDEPDLALPTSRSLVEAGILERVTVLPGVYAIDIYGSLKDSLEEAFVDRARVETLSYDWRRDNFEAVYALDRHIRRLKTRGIKRISLVAHSMGGLIAAYYLRYGTQELNSSARETWEGAKQINRAVIIGVPFRGAMDALRDMHYSVSTGWNKTLLNNMALSSFPSIYQLLPPVTEDGVILTDIGRLPTQKIFDARHWARHGWGLFNGAEKLTASDYQARTLATEQYLIQAHHLSRLLHKDTTSSSISLAVLNIIGKGYPTLAKAAWLPERNSLPLFTNKALEDSPISAAALFEDGDGVVTAFSAMIPEAYHQVFDINTLSYRHEHLAIIQQKEVQNAVIAFLREGIAAR